MLIYFPFLDSLSNNGQSEDSKISKILRKIVNEDDTRSLITLCNQLQVFYVLLFIIILDILL